MEPCLWLEKFPSPEGLEPEIAKSVSQTLISLEGESNSLTGVNLCKSYN